MEKEYRIDPELQSVMPELTEEEKDELEKSLLQDGYKGAPIIVWGDIIIDGHNRYSFCKKHNIPYEIKELQFEDKSEVIQWMIRAQLGRRNLNTAQRVRLVKKFRPELERQARERQGSRTDILEKNMINDIPPDLGESKTKNKKHNEVTSQLAKMANTGKETYRKAERVLDSENEEVKDKMLSGKQSIDASYKELQRLEKEGRGIVKPKQNKDTPASRREESNKNSDNKSSDIRLKEVQSRYANVFTALQTDIIWLTEKEFFDDGGDELTSRIRSELENCVRKLQEVGKIISRMKDDDCGDENVIILEK